MEILKYGSSGKNVELWQKFLIKQGYKIVVDDGFFGLKTADSTILFQKKHKLEPDCIVGKNTLTVAKKLGFTVPKEKKEDNSSSDLPPEPKFSPIKQTTREKIFGKFSYKIDLEHPRMITVTDNWVKENIETIKIPQLGKINSKFSKIKFHKKASKQMIALWEAWEAKGLTHLILDWGGSYVPRYVRGNSTNTLSNHAFGIAFDINLKYNPYKKQPAKKGEKGSVVELVKIANKFGFYWGGHFPTKYIDGMHFEVAKLVG